MHHSPNTLISAVAKLPLKLTSRHPLLTEGHKGHSQVPLEYGQFGTFHHGATTQTGAETTLAALPLPFGFQPIVFSAFALLAHDTLFFSDRPKMFPAPFFQIGRASCRERVCICVGALD